MTTGNCNEGNLVLKVRRKNVNRFHAGSELSSSVNRMNVDVSEDRDERFETLSVQISLSKEICSKEPEKPIL
jgi:hypothetical protein